MKSIVSIILLILSIIFISCNISKSSDDLFKFNLIKFKNDQANEDIINEFRKMAKQGHKYSQYFLGTLALAQRIDLEEGVKWLKEANEGGCAGATSALGMLYLQGHGVKQNPVLAEQFILKAAKKGDLSSQVAMAGFYKNGTARIPVDNLKAYAWISLAYDQCFSSKLKPIYFQMKKEFETEFIGDELNSAIIAAKELKEQIGIYEYSYCSQSSPILPDM